MMMSEYGKKTTLFCKNNKFYLQSEGEKPILLDSYLMHNERDSLRSLLLEYHTRRIHIINKMEKSADNDLITISPFPSDLEKKLVERAKEALTKEAQDMGMYD